MVQTWEGEITSGNLGTSPVSVFLPKASLQHQITPKAKAPLLLLVVSLSFLTQSPRNSPLDTNEFQAAQDTPAFCGPLDPQGLGMPGQNPVTAHPLGKISCITMTPAEGNLRLRWAPRFQTP